MELDPDMRSLMEAADMQYTVIVDTKSYNKPGLNPTTKNGTEMGIVKAGFVFTPLSDVNGWLSIVYNKWIMASACKPVTVPPPPVDPPASNDYVRAVFVKTDGTADEYSMDKL